MSDTSTAADQGPNPDVYDELPDAPPKSRLRLSWVGKVSVVVVAFWVLMAFIGPWIAPYGESHFIEDDVLGNPIDDPAFMLPDQMIGIKGKKRQEEIGRTLPDVIDHITISVEAGLGFTAALAHVSRQVEGPMAVELRQTMQDLKVGMSRTKAFDKLIARTDVPDVRTFVIALRQAEKMGVPLDAVSIGHLDGDYLDPRCQWLQRREIAAEGALLVRPDRFVAWRSAGASRTREADLRLALETVLRREPSGKGS